MSIISTSAIQRTACLGVGFLMGAAVLAACGETPDQVATLAPVDAKVAPAAPHAFKDGADKAAMLVVRAENATRPTPKVAKAYVFKDGADKAAMLVVRAQKTSADAIERAAAVSAHASADASEHHALGQSESAHRSADAVERWALSSTDG